MERCGPAGLTGSCCSSLTDNWLCQRCWIPQRADQPLLDQLLHFHAPFSPSDARLLARSGPCASSSWNSASQGRAATRCRRRRRRWARRPTPLGHAHWRHRRPRRAWARHLCCVLARGRRPAWIRSTCCWEAARARWRVPLPLPRQPPGGLGTGREVCWWTARSCLQSAKPKLAVSQLDSDIIPFHLPTAARGPSPRGGRRPRKPAYSQVPGWLRPILGAATASQHHCNCITSCYLLC